MTTVVDISDTRIQSTDLYYFLRSPASGRAMNSECSSELISTAKANSLAADFDLFLSISNVIIMINCFSRLGVLILRHKIMYTFLDVCSQLHAFFSRDMYSPSFYKYEQHPNQRNFQSHPPSIPALYQPSTSEIGANSQSSGWHALPRGPEARPRR